MQEISYRCNEALNVNWCWGIPEHRALNPNHYYIYLYSFIFNHIHSVNQKNIMCFRRNISYSFYYYLRNIVDYKIEIKMNSDVMEWQFLKLTFWKMSKIIMGKFKVGKFQIEVILTIFYCFNWRSVTSMSGDRDWSSTDLGKLKATFKVLYN